MCRMSQQGTEKSIFRVIFRIDFDIVTTMILQIPFPDSTYFELKVLIVECATLESYENKNLLNVPARNREAHFQSYLSNWLWHYDYNDSANTISRFNLFRIESFVTGVFYFRELRKTIC